MLCNILHRSSKLHCNKRFIECPFDNGDSDNNNGNTKRHLSYQEGYLVTKQHETWIKQILAESISSQPLPQIPSQTSITREPNNEPEQKQRQQQQNGKTGKNVDNIEIVVAYLSFNSPDLLLSIMGCMNLTTTVFDQRLMDHADNNINDDHARRKIGNTRARVRVRIRIAMLNARWSAKEIALALSIKGQNRCKTTTATTIHKTILLYGPSMFNIAKDACIIMNSTSRNNNDILSHHVVSTTTEAFAIPTLTLKFKSSLDEELSISNRKGNKNDNISIQTSNENINEDTKANIHDEAIILFTSGTTSGKPKGVILSHLAMFIQAMAKTQKPCCYDEHTKMLATTVPFFHVAGINSAFAIMMVGGCLVFPKTQKQRTIGFDAKLALDSIIDSKQYENSHSFVGTNKNDIDATAVTINNNNGVNTLVIVPAMLHAIINEVRNQLKTSAESKAETATNMKCYENVRLLLVGGQSITEPQLEQSKHIFPNAKIIQTYACTEAGSSMTFATKYDPSTNEIDYDNSLNNSNGTYSGVAPPHIQLAIFVVKDNKPTLQFAPPFKVGAIGTKGPHIMNGYWKRGKSSICDEDNGGGAGVGDGISPHQWLITSDLGYIDNKGGLHFCGRLNDVIRTGGETVFAPEVESVIIQHPNVDQCAVFGLLDERFGECVCVAIVWKKTSSSIDRKSSEILEEGGSRNSIHESIRDFCQQKHLSHYKRPRKIYLLDNLPCNSSGKVLKHVLKRKFSIQSKL